MTAPWSSSRQFWHKPCSCERHFSVYDSHRTTRSVYVSMWLRGSHYSLFSLFDKTQSSKSPVALRTTRVCSKALHASLERPCSLGSLHDLFSQKHFLQFDGPIAHQDKWLSDSPSVQSFSGKINAALSPADVSHSPISSLSNPQLVGSVDLRWQNSTNPTWDAPASPTAASVHRRNAECQQPHSEDPTHFRWRQSPSCAPKFVTAEMRELSCARDFCPTSPSQVCRCLQTLSETTCNNEYVCSSDTAVSDLIEFLGRAPTSPSTPQQAPRRKIPDQQPPVRKSLLFAASDA